MNLYSKSESGLSLLGVLVATFILAGSVVAIAQLVAANQSNAGIARERFTATTLAREGLELVYAKRDSNWFELGSGEADPLNPAVTWMSGLCEGVVVADHSITIEPDPLVDIFITHSPSTAQRRLYQTSNGQYTHIGTGNKETMFERFLELDCGNAAQLDPFNNETYMDAVSIVTELNLILVTTLTPQQKKK